MNSTPETTVELGLDLSALGGPFLTLDDPVKGQLDDPDYPLSGIFFYDVTDRVRALSVTRGKSRQLDKFTAGGATIQLNNNDRAFDPENTASPFFGQIIPKRTMRIITDSKPVFYGAIEDWNLSYDISGLSTASADCVDGFSLLSQVAMTAHTAIVQTTGERFEAVLDRPEVNWPDSLRDIDLGQATLQADVVDLGTTVLDYLQLVNISEPGFFFMGKDGKIVFKDRTVSPIGTGLTVFSDDGTGIEFQDINIVYGTELLYNQIIIERANGGVSIAEDLSSIELYGRNTLEISGVLLEDDTQAEFLAGYLLALYAEPEYRFETLSVDLHNLDYATQQELLDLEIENLVQIKFTPNGVGSQIDKFATIIRIDHEVQPMQHRITFGFQTLNYANFILDDLQFGILDTSRLAF